MTEKQNGKPIITTLESLRQCLPKAHGDLNEFFLRPSSLTTLPGSVDEALRSRR